MATPFAELLEIRKDDTGVIGVILYTDSATFKIIEPLALDQLTPIGFKNRVRTRLDNLVQGSGVLLKTLAPGVIDLTPEAIDPPPPPDPPPTPTPDELAKQAYGARVTQWRQFKGAAAAGIDVTTALTVAQADLVKDFLPGYEVFFSSPF